MLSPLGVSMPSDFVVNDAILQPYLLAQDSYESQRQLLILLSEHAEARLRAIIMSRLRSIRDERSTDFEDLFSETKTRLLTYLSELKSDRITVPCEDFRGYVAAIAHNACHDHFRETYPARARLHKKLRDLLHANSSFGLWKTKDQSKGDWLCGFDYWRGQTSSSDSKAWLQRFYENPEAVIEAISSGGDIQRMEIDDLLDSIFADIGGPLSLADLVDIVSDIRGIKDLPVSSFDANVPGVILRLPDSKLRIDSVLEMREPLTRVWQGLCELPRDQFRAYLLYARDSSGEDLISLLLDAEITTESELAALLKISIDQFRELCVNMLPLDNETIAKEMGIKVEKVYKLRCQAGKQLKRLLSTSVEKHLCLGRNRRTHRLDI